MGNRTTLRSARALFEESLAIQRLLGSRSGIATALTNLGNVESYTGNYQAGAFPVSGESDRFSGTARHRPDCGSALQSGQYHDTGRQV